MVLLVLIVDPNLVYAKKRLRILAKDYNSCYPNMALAIDEPTVVDTVLYYALFLGAMFQLICILSVIILPKSIEEQLDENDHPISPVESSAISNPKPSQDHSRRGKKQSKKHR